MNRNQVEGTRKHLKGAIKETTSKLTGNRAGQAEGKAQKNLGKAQGKLGSAQQRARRNEGRH